MNMTVDIKDDGDKYIWMVDEETSVEINHGEILKDLLYIEKGVFDQAYSEMIRRLKFEDLAERIDMSNSSEEMLKLNAKLSVVTPEDKIYADQFDIKEAFYLAQTIIGYRTTKDIHAVIGEENLWFLCDLITCDLYNIGKKCSNMSDFDNYIPSFFSIADYTQHIKNLLLNRKCDATLVEFCSAGRIETGFSVEDDSETYYISALDQFVRLEIRNMMSKKSHNLQFCECEICKRLFSRGGSGSYKKVRCSYPYEIPCDMRIAPKDDVEQYKTKLSDRIRTHDKRHSNLTNSNVDWRQRAYDKINKLVEEGKDIQEITTYMDGTWWKTVKRYGEINGIDWSQF